MHLDLAFLVGRVQREAVLREAAHVLVHNEVARAGARAVLNDAHLRAFVLDVAREGLEIFDFRFCGRANVVVKTTGVTLNLGTSVPGKHTAPGKHTRETGPVRE